MKVIELIVMGIPIEVSYQKSSNGFLILEAIMDGYDIWPIIREEIKSDIVGAIEDREELEGGFE